jgi:hypothetical protein
MIELFNISLMLLIVCHSWYPTINLNIYNEHVHFRYFRNYNKNYLTFHMLVHFIDLYLPFICIHEIHSSSFILYHNKYHIMIGLSKYCYNLFEVLCSLNNFWSWSFWCLWKIEPLFKLSRRMMNLSCFPMTLDSTQCSKIVIKVNW